MSFKKGDKAVFVNPHLTVNDFVINPPVNSVVTIAGRAPTKEETWDLVEYPTALNGNLQCFETAQLRKLSEVSAELSEEILTEVLTTIEEPIEV